MFTLVPFLMLFLLIVLPRLRLYERMNTMPPGSAKFHYVLWFGPPDMLSLYDPYAVPYAVPYPVDLAELCKHNFT